jgi:hypothetical protein
LAAEHGHMRLFMGKTKLRRILMSLFGQLGKFSTRQLISGSMHRSYRLCMNKCEENRLFAL